MANKITINTLYRILNIWFGFILSIFLASHLPHWESMNYHGWINVTLYFLLFLFALTIFIKENNNKDIFFNLSLFQLIITLSVFNVFMGSNYLLGSDKFSYYFYEFKKIAFCFVINFVIAYIALKYLFYKSKTVWIYLISIFILLPVFIYHFHPFITNPNYIFTLKENYFRDLNLRFFLTNMIAFPFIGLYGFILYKNDRTIGEYINQLMAFLFIFHVIDSIDKFSAAYNFKVFSMGQHILTLNLLFLTYLLFKKMCFLCSDYGQFYESLVSQKINLGKVKIQRRKTARNVLLLKILKIYFTQRRNYLLTLSLMFMVTFLYFRFPRYIALNIIAFISCIFILFYFIHGLYKRRSQKNYTIS